MELTLDPEICSLIVSEDVIHDESVIREAAARALVAALADNRGYAEAILNQLLALYEEKLYVSVSLSLSVAGLDIYYYGLYCCFSEVFAFSYAIKFEKNYLKKRFKKTAWWFSQGMCRVTTHNIWVI